MKQGESIGEKITSQYNRNGLAVTLLKYRRLKTMIKKNGNNEIKTLSHSTYRCQYHIVFAPKYRRKEIYGKIKKDIGEIIRKLCEQKGVEIIEAEACKDHIHLLVSIPPYLSVAQFMGYLKGKSTLMIFDRHANLKYKYGNRHFWCRGYYVDTVGRNKKVIEKYIQNQLEEDFANDQITLKEYVDPFRSPKTGPSLQTFKYSQSSAPFLRTLTAHPKQAPNPQAILSSMES